MKARSGQVALYLIGILVSILILTLMNVGTFLAVRAKNRTMNAGDAAALAVAEYQGELLNRIGKLNVEHLRAALEDDDERCEEIVREQLSICFFEPLEGIRIGNDAAKRNDAEKSEAMAEIFRTHVADIKRFYVTNPEVYPEPFDGAWNEYAARLETAIANDMYAGPDNADFLDAAGGHFLLQKEFYHAIAARDWCWFHYNAAGLLDAYSGFRDWAPLPTADEETRRRKCVNSEIYSLGLAVREGSALTLFGTNLIVRLTGATAREISESRLLRTPGQNWFCYDTVEPWRNWWEIDPDGEWRFPVVGPVLPQYDIRGCAAICRVEKKIPNLTGEGERTSIWSAAAKPFGMIKDEDDEVTVVTALKGLVTAAFSDVRLVPLDSVGGKDLSTADPDWMKHVHDHLPRYMENGVGATDRRCYYCQQLGYDRWENAAFRHYGSNWLKAHAHECRRPCGPGSGHGGTPHGH